MSSVWGHPWLGGLFRDKAVANALGAEAMLNHMIAVEVAWLEAQAEVGNCDPDLAARAISHVRSVDVAMDDLWEGTAQDGLPVPALVRSLKVGASDDVKGIIHVGLTSQDVMDTALMMAIRPVFGVFQERVGRLQQLLGDLAETHGQNGLMGYTRMQAALPITADLRVDTWQRPFASYTTQLADIADRLAILQWGGPVGRRDTPQANAVGATFAARLGLRDPGFSWHSNRQDLSALAGLLTQITGSLGKMGQDIALMAQRGADEAVLRGGGGSSAMPHKQNPIKAELLVTLAHHAAALQMNMTTAMIHEQERSGVMWALEWMTLPDLLQTAGRSLSAAVELLDQIDQIGADPAQS